MDEAFSAVATQEVVCLQVACDSLFCIFTVAVLSHGQTSSVSTAIGASARQKKDGKSAFICPCHLGAHVLQSTWYAGPVPVCSIHVGHV